MDKYDNSLSERIESGQYFKDAMNWYHSKFTNVQTQFSLMLIVAIIAFLAFIITFSGLVAFLPITEKKLFVVYQSITPDTRLTLQTLSHPGDNPHLQLGKYYISEYVKSREEYSPARNDRNLNFVSLMSDDATLQDYLNYTSNTNPESPVIIYANRGTRDIVIKDFAYVDAKGNEVDEPSNPQYAVVKFVAKENFGNEGSKISNYQANISFKYDKLEVDQKTQKLTKEPKIVITGYTTKSLTGAAE